MGSLEFEDRASEIIVEITRSEIQKIASEQFGRPLSEDELQALDDLSLIALYEWISLAIEASRVESPGE